MGVLLEVVRASARCRQVVRNTERRMLVPTIDSSDLTRLRRALRRAASHPCCAASVRCRALGLLRKGRRERANRPPSRRQPPVSLDLPTELLQLLFSKFLLPWPEWTRCRLVNRTWEAAVAALDAARALWIGPVIVTSGASQSRARLLKELTLCERIGKMDRQHEAGDDEWDWTCIWCRNRPTVQLAEELEYVAQAGPDDHDEDRYLDVLSAWHGGASRLPHTREQTSARCLVIMSVRNFDQTLAVEVKRNSSCIGCSHSALVRFAGSTWKVSVGLDTFRTVRFGCFLERVASSPELRDDESADFSIPNSLPHIIRYRAEFIARGAPLNAGVLEQRGSQRSCFDGSLACGTVDPESGSRYCAEKLPVEIARFAIAPNGWRHLLVKLELEHIAYGLELP